MSVAEVVLEAVQSLSPAQQQQVLDFVQALKQKAQTADAETFQGSNRWLESPFVGMWKDREEMKDSVEWVRQMRQQQWYRS